MVLILTQIYQISLYLLQTEQQEIGWDNLLRSKISKKWKEIQKWHETTNRFQRRQRNVRLRTSSGGYIRNPYDDNKEEKEKKQKKEKDIFQLLIEKFFIIYEEELWQQQNLDRHRPKNKTNYAEIIKTDREVHQLYGFSDEVCPTDKDQFYKVDLDTRISQQLHEKQRWITRWRPAIQSSRKRAKRDTITNTQEIWKYFVTKRPKNRTLHTHKKRLKQHKENLRWQRNAPVRGITEGIGNFQIIKTKKSSNRPPKESPKPKIFRNKFPSVTKFFSIQNKKDKPDYRFGDAGNN